MFALQCLKMRNFVFKTNITPVSVQKLLIYPVSLCVFVNTQKISLFLNVKKIEN